MEQTTDRIQHVARLGSNLSIFCAVFACLALWGGISLTMTSAAPPQATTTPSSDPVLPQPIAEWESASPARRTLADLLLLWVPIGLGTIACSSGILTLLSAREREPEAARRALIALILGVVPGCFCTLWYLMLVLPPVLAP